MLLILYFHKMELSISRVCFSVGVFDLGLHFLRRVTKPPCCCGAARRWRAGAIYIYIYIYVAIENNISYV